MLFVECCSWFGDCRMLFVVCCLLAVAAKCLLVAVCCLVCVGCRCLLAGVWRSLVNVCCVLCVVCFFPASTMCNRPVGSNEINACKAGANRRPRKLVVAVGCS